jgi:hypothetical protein
MVSMTSGLFEEIRLNAQKFVSGGLVNYEKTFGKLSTDLSRQKFLNSGLELLRRVVDRLEAKEEISILPFKQVILSVLFDLDFNIIAVKNLLPYIKEQVIDFIKTKPNYDVSFTRLITGYFELIVENVGDYSFYSSSSAVDILQAQPEYQYSEALYSLIPNYIDPDDNKIYTVIPKDRYWQTFSSQDDESSYSPLSYNRFASSLGLSKYKINISYEALIIYEDELYKLRPDISSPTRSFFDPSEWVKYTSKRFDQNKSFKTLFGSNVRAAFGKFVSEGFDVNEIISDSNVVEYSESATVSSLLLSSTFGGEGKQLLDSIKALKQLSDSFGSYEGSPVGGVEYVAQFSEYLLAASLGKDASHIFNTTGGDSSFGKFDLLYKSSTTVNRIPGLKFLDGFGALKSFVHTQEVLPMGTNNSSKVIYNPVYSQFKNGLTNRFTSLQKSTSYTEPANVDLLLFALESLYGRCLAVGDIVKAILNTLDSSGRVAAYEGLGSIKVQMDELQRVFPPTSYFTDQDINSKVSAGLTGSLKYFLNSYSRFSAALVFPVLPGKSLEFFGPWVEKINGKLEELSNIFKGIGISTKEFIPNLSFKIFEANDLKLINFLKSLGFRDSEVNKLLEVESFSQLISNFAPLTDSSDLKSFFKAYELSQLIYEFGGQDAIDSYLSFLYSNNAIDSLLNILSLSQKDKSKLTYVNINKYPKLIGLLIGLTYAVDPAQLIKFEKILGKNNLTLLESISYLYQNGETTIIKDRQDVELLQPLVEQMITGTYANDPFVASTLTYEQANNTVPIALKQWTRIIDSNLGKVGSSAIISGLYDKAKGLTPKELIAILENPNSPGGLGHVVDGFAGGAFTSFLKYATLAGLGIKLSNYKNSYQTNNFYVDTSNEFYTLPQIVESVDSVIERISIIKTILNSELDYNFSTNSDFSNSLDPLILSQNKTYEAIPQAISLLSSGAELTELKSAAGAAQIAESPGIGNSRVPNRIPVRNSVTPEQAQQLSSYSQTIAQLGVLDELPISLINKYVKFSGNNLLANDVALIDEAQALELPRSKRGTFVPATPYELDSKSARPPSKPYFAAEIYSRLDGSPNVNSEILGANYISGSESLISPFDPVSSCKKFGGVNCDLIYAESQERCIKRFSKALFPESYERIPGTLASSVVVDRPLGTFAQYNASQVLIPGSSFSTPPGFMTLLPSTASIGKRGEPLLDSVSYATIVYESGGADLSELGNTEFGIVEFIKAKLERNTEFNCAGFDSPFYYQICMNVMKCKRFSPPYNEEYYLSFCPQTLSGGRLK